MTDGTGLEPKSITRTRKVRITPQDEQKLKLLAQQYNCTYRGEPSLSKLLSRIAQKGLRIGRSEESIVKPKEPSVALIELEIEVLSDLNGTLAEIAKQIADRGGNIYRAWGVDRRRNSNIKIALHLPEKYNLRELIKSLYETTIEQVWRFNEKRQLEALLGVIDPVALKSYQQKKKYERPEDRYLTIEDYFNPKSKKFDNSEYRTQRLVTNLICTVGYKVVIHNKLGTLAKFTRKLAENKYSISSVDIDFNFDEDKNLVCFCLGFCPTIDDKASPEDDVFLKMKTAQQFVKDLESLDYVEKGSVEQISVYYLYREDK